MNFTIPLWAQIAILALCIPLFVHAFLSEKRTPYSRWYVLLLYSGFAATTTVEMIRLLYAGPSVALTLLAFAGRIVILFAAFMTAVEEHKWQ